MVMYVMLCLLIKNVNCFVVFQMALVFFMKK